MITYFGETMKLLNIKKATAVLLSSLLIPTLASAALTDDELARLGIEGTELTPMGAIRAGNAEGTIPAWESTPIKGVPGDHADSLPDPFADDKPLFTITAANYQEYAEKLTAGQIAMFKQFPETFKMNVYQTRRTGASDPWVYEATLAQAKKVRVCDALEAEGRVCMEDHIPGGGIPFPIPKTGVEAAWSNFVSYRGTTMDKMGNGALVDSNGDRTDVIIRIRQAWPWWLKEDSKIRAKKWFARDEGSLFCDSWQVEKPPRSSGLVFGGCNYVDKFDFQAYLYVPGQRRVRKAPEIGFHDSPLFGSDGQRTVTSRFMYYFGGSFLRHDIGKPVKKELFVPYNNYKLTNADTSFDEIFGEEHVNQDLIRYELHRVWVIEGTLKKGMRHLYKRHTGYFDEDTWAGLAYEAYNSKGQLWRVGEQYNAFIYGPNVTVPVGDIQLDLINGRYTTFPYSPYQAGKEMGFGGPKIDSSPEDVEKFNVGIFTPQGLRKYGKR